MAQAAGAELEVGQLIDQRPMSPTQVLVAVCCAAALFVDGYDIQVMALAVPSLSQAWALPPSSFGLALSAVVIGISIGSGLLGPLGDRIGRRTSLIAAMLSIGLATAATSLARSPAEFVGWRLLTGVALGFGVPNCAALTSEYAPVRCRSLVMSLMNCAIGVGAFSAGFIAPPVLEAFGWRGTFLVGGVAPILIALLFLAAAPESLKFLAIRRPRDARIARILARIAPDVQPAAIYAETQAQPSRSPLQLLSRELRARTLLLWTLVALNLFTLYVLISWLPTLLQQAGWAPSAALRGAVLIQAGGVVGGLGLSLLLDRGRTREAMAIAFVLTAVCLGLFLVVPSGAAWAGLLLLVGGGVSGAQLSLNALSAAYYPPAIKATGVGWVGVLGGAGSMLGPLAGAWLIDRHLQPTQILALLAAPCLVCAGLMLATRRQWQAH
jgi:AAHS family 4-hydroxybenzoate transporter-like MFS transporter